MSVEEIERLTLAVTDIRYRTAITLSYGAGLRISETVGVKVSHIIADRNLLHIPSGKGGTERMAPLPANLVGHLRGYWRNIYPRPVSWTRPVARAGSARTRCAMRSRGPRQGRRQQNLHLPLLASPPPTCMSAGAASTSYRTRSVAIPPGVRARNRQDVRGPSALLGRARG